MTGADPIADRGHAAQAAAELVAIDDPDLRRAARLAMRERALRFRFQARRRQGVSRLADAIAKFGGGSLLTATLLVVVGGHAGDAVVVMAALTLLLFVGGTIFWVYHDRLSASFDHRADRIEAVLIETER